MFPFWAFLLCHLKVCEIVERFVSCEFLCHHQPVVTVLPEPWTVKSLNYASYFKVNNDRRSILRCKLWRNDPGWEKPLWKSGNDGPSSGSCKNEIYCNPAQTFRNIPTSFLGLQQEKDISNATTQSYGICTTSTEERMGMPKLLESTLAIIILLLHELTAFVLTPRNENGTKVGIKVIYSVSSSKCLWNGHVEPPPGNWLSVRKVVAHSCNRKEDIVGICCESINCVQFAIGEQNNKSDCTAVTHDWGAVLMCLYAAVFFRAIMQYRN